uniref:SH2 domain-containing protein n=1 Tax=Monopterus albus TaxID=43700 RepID=A0A3Q3J720_MONAL|nr:SH2 domain-containing protein 7-like [Monopterus albus]
MVAEMTPASNHALLIARKGPRTKNQKHPKSQCLRSCLTFCLKAQVKTDQREPQMDSLTEGAEGRFRELASKWFIETQVPLIVHNGFFPTWFLGFITRKDAEEILSEKELGCFLIRLSDKAIGYILSYKGRDRCRHFVINQNEAGQFVVCGDTEGHSTVSDLIEYYKTSPIEPFGEYLTSSCYEVLNEELYDIIQISPKEKPAVASRAEKNLQKQHANSASAQPPTWPPKSNRTLEKVPPLPRRNRHLDSGPLNDQDRVLYAQLRKQSPRKIQRSQPTHQDKAPGDNPRRAQRTTALDHISQCSPPPGPNSASSELGLLECSKTRSLPLLDNTSDREQYRLSSSPYTPPRLSPKPTSHTPWSEKTESCSRQSSSHSPDYTRDSAVYHLAGRPGSPHAILSEASDSVYAEISEEALFGHFPHDNTYELIPGHEDTAHTKLKSNTYELLDDIRPKILKNDKWKWLFPEVKRKW